MEFVFKRDIDAAARDVQAAINAARGQLPAGMPGNPTYRKSNPSQAPIMALALSSPNLAPGTLYDIAATVLAQKISQIQGVGEVSVVPPMAALSNAIYRALGVRLTQLPMAPGRVLEALWARESAPHNGGA